MSVRFSCAAPVAAAFALLAGPALVRCSKNLVEERLGSGLHFASLDNFQLAGKTSANRAVITFVGHASFQIDAPRSVRAITADNGFGGHPEIVTMNNAHGTHFTAKPEYGITCILRCWPGESKAKRDVRLKDMHVWNMPTNARGDAETS